MDPRIASAFSSGVILPPDPNHPDLVHLTRAIAKITGVRRFGRNTLPVQRLADCIGQPRHLVFVLVDGLGANLLDRLPRMAFLVRNLRTLIRAVAPSTTACSLTSIATGTWPSEHGITGWYTHVQSRGLTVTTLHMVERFSGEPVAQRGISVEELLPIPAIHPEMSSTPLTLLPAAIAETAFARYSRGGTRFAPYTDLPNAAAQILDFVKGASGPTYSHLYLPDVDTACHRYGTRDDRVDGVLRELDEQLAALSDALPVDARLVVSADHGLIDVSHEAHLPLTGEDQLASFLEAPPSGDGRTPIFHVRDGCEGEFVRCFHKQYGQGFALMTRDEAESLGVFGPGPMSVVSRQRFGSFVGIALQAVILHYASRRSPPPQHVYRAQHAGLTPDELMVPLVVA